MIPRIAVTTGEPAGIGPELCLALGKRTGCRFIWLSATVDPRIPPMFRETIYFFRDSVSSTQILGEKHSPIGGATPTCVNMALSMAAFLGFTDMALFGADCGIRPGSDDHAKDTVYRDIGTFQKNGDIDERYPVEVEGNFGVTTLFWDVVFGTSLEARSRRARSSSLRGLGRFFG